MNLHLQTSTPSDHLWSTFLLTDPPQFVYQAPPGAQQLTLPDFKNVPHFEHVIVLAIIEVTVAVMTDVVIGVLDMSSRAIIGRRDTCGREVAEMGAEAHIIPDIDPYDPENMRF